MKREALEKNIQVLLDFYKQKQKELQGLFTGVKNEGNERDVLDSFLNFLELEKNDESRFAAYNRIATLKDDSLKLYLKKTKLTDDERENLLYEAYIFVKNYHFDIFSEIIEKTEEETLLSPFYLEVMKGTHTVGEAFSDFYLAWHSYIINTLNKNLEVEFEGDSQKILDYLEQNNLGADKIDGISVDRSYSTLIPLQMGEGIEQNAASFSPGEREFKREGGNEEYKVVSYAEAFHEEISDIVTSLEEFIGKLENLEDDIYQRKKAYLHYLHALKSAFFEKDMTKLVKKWRAVDETWMEIDTPFQIGHPLEFYEDLYRKSVAPEWDFRIVDTSLFESHVSKDILNMYEELYDDIGRCKYQDSYEYSLENQKRVQLYISAPVLYYGDELTGLFSAQVVPNDEEVSKAYGKKIFAYPGFVLEGHRAAPVMKTTTNIFEASFIKAYREYLFSDSKNYFGVYDIETIGHEYGHTLWLDLDSESLMNATGNFKNIEEFKATTGGMVAYFMKENSPHPNPLPKGEGIDQLNQCLMVHIHRCVGLLKYREIEDIIPYYCEALIHLDVLFESGIIEFNGEKILFKNTPENYKKLKEKYLSTYKKLIYTYLKKEDANVFLADYAEKNAKVFLPKDPKIKEFVEYYYDMYLKIGNEIDEAYH